MAPRRRLNWNDPGVRSVVYQVLALAAAGLGRVVPGFQHATQPVRAQHRHGLRVPEPRSRVRDRRNAHRLHPRKRLTAAPSWSACSTRLRVAVIGIVLATILGTLIGIGRLSKNWLVAKITSVYVEVMRNVPLLLQLFFWYALITENMPGPRQAHNPLPGVFISNRGLKVPGLEGHFAGLDAGRPGPGHRRHHLPGPLRQEAPRSHRPHVPAGPLGHRPADRAAVHRLAGQRRVADAGHAGTEGLQLRRAV